MSRVEKREMNCRATRYSRDLEGVVENGRNGRSGIVGRARSVSVERDERDGSEISKASHGGREGGPRGRRDDDERGEKIRRRGRGAASADEEEVKGGRTGPRGAGVRGGVRRGRKKCVKNETLAEDDCGLRRGHGARIFTRSHPRGDRQEVRHRKS